MTSQHPGHFLHRLDFRSHRFRTPPIQKLTGPVGGNVTPEELERLLQQVGPHAAKVVLQQFRQPALLRIGQMFRSLQQQPAAFRQNRLISLGLQLLHLAGTHFVQGLAEMGHDVEPVECRVPCDYIPKRSYPLFRTRQILNDWLTQNLEEA